MFTITLHQNIEAKYKLKVKDNKTLLNNITIDQAF